MATVKTIRGVKVRIVMPNYPVIIRTAVRQFMPIAGDYIRLRAQRKIGIYQPGWAPLAPSTLARKARTSRMRGRRGIAARKARLYDTDFPLLDTRKMHNSIRRKVLSGNSVAVEADFPIGQHEQDTSIAPFAVPANIPLPARPLLGPTLTESIDPLTDKLERLVETILI